MSFQGNGRLLEGLVDRVGGQVLVIVGGSELPRKVVEIGLCGEGVKRGG